MSYVPVVGEVCEYAAYGCKFMKCEVMYLSATLIVIKVKGADMSFRVGEASYRPIKTDREKFIELAAKLECKRDFRGGTLSSLQESIVGQMFDSGLYQLKEKNND
jgi:hypothetical protein